MHQSTPFTKDNSLRPEWVKVPDACRIFGLGRSKIYELIRSGEVRSACVRARGQVKGIRLISYDSLNAFIEENVMTV